MKSLDAKQASKTFFEGQHIITKEGDRGIVFGKIGNKYQIKIGSFYTIRKASDLTTSLYNKLAYEL